MDLFYSLLQCISEYINKITFPQIILCIFTICIFLERLPYSLGNQLCAFSRMESILSTHLISLHLTAEASSIDALNMMTVGRDGIRREAKVEFELHLSN